MPPLGPRQAGDGRGVCTDPFRRRAGLNQASHRIAVVAGLDSEERDKIPLILEGIRLAGHEPLLVDAELFVHGGARISRTAMGRYVFRTPALRMDVCRELTGWYREINGRQSRVSIHDVHAALFDCNPRRSDALHHTGAQESPVIDALWPECLDIERRGDFKELFREINSSNIPSLAGSWTSVLAVSFKDRTAAALEELPTPVPYARTRVLPPDPALPELLALRADLGEGDLWVKPSSSTHGRDVTFIPAGETDDPDTHILDIARHYQGKGGLLIQEDVRSIVRDENGKIYRTDLAIIVLDRNALQVTARVQADLAKPTNSSYGGHSIHISPKRTPRPLVDLAVQAIAVTGNRYGSVDIFGGCFDWPGMTVVETRPPVIGEINLQPGGRSPGFREQVVPALVNAYLHAIENRSG